MQFRTCILSLEQSCKYLSNRADECSGPCPSYPWGNNITNPEALDHFLSPDAINWSMITCAPLAKSPNWASHKVSVLGSTSEYPYSKPKTASSDKKLSTTSYCFWSSEIWFNGMYLLLSTWFLRTECLWLKVPLPESWPTSLTGKPSWSNEPKASDSAVAQSIPEPSSIDFFLNSKIFEIVLWGLISWGSTFILFEIAFNCSICTPLTPLLSFPGSGLYLDQVPSNQVILGL